MKQIPVCSLEETGELGLKLASLIKPGMLITLSGDLGAGKTTFTKYLGKGLGVKKQSIRYLHYFKNISGYFHAGLPY